MNGYGTCVFVYVPAQAHTCLHVCLFMCLLVFIHVQCCNVSYPSIYVYMCYLYIYIHISVHIHTDVCMHLLMCLSVYTCIHACIYLCSYKLSCSHMYTYISAYIMYLYTHVHCRCINVLYAYMYTCLHVSLFTCLCIQVCMYLCVHVLYICVHEMLKYIYVFVCTRVQSLYKTVCMCFVHTHVHRSFSSVKCVCICLCVHVSAYLCAHTCISVCNMPVCRLWGGGVGPGHHHQSPCLWSRNLSCHPAPWGCTSLFPQGPQQSHRPWLHLPLKHKGRSGWVAVEKGGSSPLTAPFQPSQESPSPVSLQPCGGSESSGLRHGGKLWFSSATEEDSRVHCLRKLGGRNARLGV